MKIYLYFHGYYSISVTFGSNALENPVFWASVIGAILGLVLGLLLGICLLIFQTEKVSHKLLIGFLVPFFCILFWLFFESAEKSDFELSRSFLVLSALYILPSLMTVFVGSKINTIISNLK